MTELDAIRAGDIDVAYRIEGRCARLDEIGALSYLHLHGIDSAGDAS